jgi:hypothetical protein
MQMRLYLPYPKQLRMKRTILLGIFICMACASGHAQVAAPDTVRTGIYITSIHDIDFKQNEYTINLWLWLRYKNKSFNFDQNLEIPQAKSFSKLYTTIDSSNGGVYMLMKLQCIMKDSWRIDNFPFDKQRLRLGIENSQYDSRSLVFSVDTLGRNFDPRFTLRGWTIDSFTMTSGIRVYETAFGDSSFSKPHTEYGTFRVRIVIARDAGDLFAKIFLGMYVAFLIAFICFYIHPDYIDSRFSLGVGALFAVIGNKYIIDSTLPESTFFTLVDTLHGITLFFILVIVSASVFSLRMLKLEKTAASRKFDTRAAVAIVVVYTLLNVGFILKAQLQR